jgi:exonuclease SbcC
MIILKKIHLKNFLSHSDTILELKENEKLLLDGKSGAGKSSIIDSLVWALYGRGRSENRSLIKKGKKYTSISVLLSCNNIIYNVTRSITNTGKHDLLVTYKKATGKRFLPVEASGIKNLQEYIEKQILHSSYLLFLNSIIYPQDNVDNFVKQSAARRKEIILEIVNASDYDKYYEKAKDKVRELETTIGINDRTQ